MKENQTPASLLTKAHLCERLNISQAKCGATTSSVCFDAK